MMGAMARAGNPQEEQAHDVLAAEAFGVPAPDPDLHHHGPVVLPDDPTGDAEPHDVLAAEEFPMPAARPGVCAARRGSSRRFAIGAAMASVLAVVVLRKRRTVAVPRKRRK
jgi:hypothetical protein